MLPSQPPQPSDSDTHLNSDQTIKANSGPTTTTPSYTSAILWSSDDTYQAETRVYFS